MKVEEEAAGTNLPRVGWVGLGTMGLPMAHRLVEAGYRLRVVGHLRRGPVEQMRQNGATEVACSREAAEQSDVFVCMVRNEAEADAVLVGSDGAVNGMKCGSILIIMSTLSPNYCRRIAQMCEVRDVALLDAPVSGGGPAALAGTLSIMVGGDGAVLENVRHILDRLGNHVFHLGGVGAGQTAKIVNNAIKTTILGITTEALALGRSAGLDVDSLLEVLRSSSARSHVVEHWDYYYKFKTEHRPGGPLDMIIKDITYALELAAELNVDVPLMLSAGAIDVGRLIDEGDRENSR